MRLLLFYRKPYKIHWSIEGIFNDLAKGFNERFSTVEFVSPWYSRGIADRIKAVRWARKQADSDTIYHITGDVHFLAMGLPSSNTVLTVHDLSFLKRGNFFSRFILWLFWVYWPINRVKFVTCVSEVTRRDVLKYSFCKAEKVKVIPNFVRGEFRYVKKEFDRSQPRLLQIGTFYNKNLERVATALKGIPCHLRIIGDLSEWQKKTLQENNIHFSNAYNLDNERLVAEYIDCDILLFCSTAEGFGLPIVEAQSVGRPVLTSNISAMPEVAGSAACLVDPFDVNSIRSGVEKLIRDDGYREQLILSGFENVKRFRREEVMQQYVDLYNRMKPA